jgi:outer membrane protein assembly factor BamB
VGTGDSTPALVGEKLFVLSRQGSEEVIRCMDAADGKELWQQKYAAPTVTGPPSQHPGPASSPLVADGKVLALGVSGIVSCVEMSSGKLLWRRDDFPANWARTYTAFSPILVDGLCIIQLGEKGSGQVIALDVATGQTKWTCAGDGPAFASPSLMSVDGVRQIITLTEKSVVGIGVADGKLLWQIPFPFQGSAQNACTPIVDGTTMIFTGQGRGTTAVKIEKQGDAYSVSEMWNNPQVGSQFSTPVLKNGFLYGLSDRGLFFCMNAKTGEAVWTDTVRRANFGAIIDGGDVILALTQNSTLSVFQATRDAYKELASIKVADKQTYAHPIVSGKRIFVKDLDSVALLVIE